MTMITDLEYVNGDQPQYPLKDNVSIKKHTPQHLNRMWEKALQQMRKNTLKRAQNKISKAQKNLKRAQNTHRAAKREWKKEFRVFQKTQKKCPTSTPISTSDELHTQLFAAKIASENTLYAVRAAEKELTRAQIAKKCLVWTHCRT